MARKFNPLAVQYIVGMSLIVNKAPPDVNELDDLAVEMVLVGMMGSSRVALQPNQGCHQSPVE